MKSVNRVLPISAINMKSIIHDSTISGNTSILFQGIVRIVRNKEDLASHFSYELAPIPLSLFDEINQIKAALFNVFESIDVPYIKSHYCQNCVVFDGYSDTEMDIKNVERSRRAKRLQCADIVVEGTTTPIVSQKTFLVNTKKKNRFIKLISGGIQVQKALDDAHDQLLALPLNCVRLQKCSLLVNT
ncbi:hypothetical protein PR048_016190 [Dryococelus australis]|uniref:Uncharacterized protein n=1 Tax=Dryococelus australis TaxID=614101 RepID=A0ABQ9HK60_9NEOP|nr:hypothetical protein PR048_016190 [Dryococelus australis]